MRMLPALCSWALLLAASHGCGGDVKVDDRGDRGAGGSSSSGPSSSSLASTGAGGSIDCPNFLDRLEDLYDAASACSPADPTVHCMALVDGLCCHVFVESASSPATQEFLDFLHRSQKQCPEQWAACPPTCPVTPPSTCVPDSSPQGGHCG